jgi:phosphomannomutase
LLSISELPGVAIGFDTRFMSERFARKIGKVLKANGIKVYLSDQFIPTPVLSFNVKHRELDAGLMVTASHNPYYYNGLKFKASYGGSAMKDLTNSIEQNLYQSPVPNHQQIELASCDFIKDYKNHLEKIINFDIINSFHGKIIFDSMYGAGSGFLQQFIAESSIKLESINNKINPNFGNILPEPIPDNLQKLRARVKSSDAILGIATDGDADRFGIIDDEGNFVQLHDLMPILFEYLVKFRDWPGNIVRTTSMADTIDKIADQYNREVFEVPVGFKNVCEKMLTDDILIGGEESGGFGYKNHIPERDGILSILLVLEMLAREETTIKEKVNTLRQKLGPFAYDRIDQYCDREKTARNMAKLKSDPPDRIGEYKINNINTIDGIKFYLEKDAWMLIRLSQTEPLFRIYVAARDQEAVDNILKSGKKLLTQ